MQRLPHTCCRKQDDYTIHGQSDHIGYEAINFGRKFGLCDAQWQPKVIAEMNDYQLTIVKLQSDLMWHDHKDTDETFLVLDGSILAIARTCARTCRRAD